MDKDLKNLIIAFLIAFCLIFWQWRDKPHSSYKGGCGGGAENSVNFDGTW